MTWMKKKLTYFYISVYIYTGMDTHAVYFKISLISETLGFIFSHFINSKTCLTRERRHFQTVKKITVLKKLNPVL